MSFKAAAETLPAIETGDAGKGDFDPQVLKHVRDVERRGEQAATKSAAGELGQTEVDWLGSIAGANPEVAAMIREYPAARAQGLHDGVSWEDVYNFHRQQIAR